MKPNQSLKNVLLKHGFQKINMKDTVKPNAVCYEHKAKGWFADFGDIEMPYTSVWVVGKELKSVSSYPGGWTYDSPAELDKELTAKI